MIVFARSAEAPSQGPRIVIPAALWPHGGLAGINNEDPTPMTHHASSHPATIVLLARPEPAEAAALAQAGAYLMRAGAAAAHALFAAGPAAEAAVLATMSDELLAAARLCADVVATSPPPAASAVH